MGSDRRFEAIVLDWHGAVASDDGTDLGAIRDHVEAAADSGLHLALVVGDEAGVIDGALRARPRGPGRLGEFPDRDAASSWLSTLGVGPGLVLFLDGELDRAGLTRLLADQVERRRRGEVPCADVTPGWALTVDAIDPEHERANAALLTIADGCIGSTGSPTIAHPASEPRLMTADVYDEPGPATHLLYGPVWYVLEGDPTGGRGVRRVLDLRTGLLHETAIGRESEHGSPSDAYRSVRFSSLHRPGTVALRAVHAEAASPASRVLQMPEGRSPTEERLVPGEHAIRLAASEGGGLAACVVERVDDAAGGIRERIGAYLTDPDRLPELESARAAAHDAADAGFEQLLGEHRQAWAARWEDADVVIEGDDEMQLAVRAALYHLIGSAPDHGEAAVGARGLSGPAYAGHVFWDSDIFVLPVLAATHPGAARAMLEYRVRRLGAAQQAARNEGRRGARYPWESAKTGFDVTPTFAQDLTGRIVPIRTGQLEIHIVACVAWAASAYLEWTGDQDFAAGAGRTLLIETARYWASRIRADASSGHIYGVIGPDEYHEPVDDSAFTNVMAGWNLRRAAAAVREFPDGDVVVEQRECDRWIDLAGKVVDGFDPETKIYEEFAGFHSLEPLLATRVLPRRPMPADLVLGAERVHQSQLVKQADVLMLHHLVPSEVEPGSLVPNLDYYEPRTSHGSSLSPAIHAALMARVGRADQALETLRMAAYIDLHDTTSTTAGGVHVATLGGIWQAVVLGFCGLRPHGDALRLDPILPGEWDAIDARVRFRGARVRIRVEPDTVSVSADRPVRLIVGRSGAQAGPEGVMFQRDHDTWRISPRDARLRARPMEEDA